MKHNFFWHIARVILALVGMLALVLGGAETTDGHINILWSVSCIGIFLLAFHALGKWFLTDEEKNEEV